MDLSTYQRFKFQLAELLRAATMDSVSFRQETAEQVRDVFERIAEDRFNLVVVGRFNRGKTTLMNAMLGSDRLPTGIVPLTSVITTVTYGTEENVILYRENSNLFSEVPLEELDQYITERGNPGNGRRIRTVEVHMPAEILRRGFHFIDTPGLGSSIIENTRTTEAFLPEADAFILVTSYDSPLSEEEKRIAQVVCASNRQVFLVLNKQDAADPDQRRQVIDHLSVQLQVVFGTDTPPIFSVSAQQALTARLQGDSAALVKSGVPALEAAITDFLVNGLRRAFLLNLCARVCSILDSRTGFDAELEQLHVCQHEILTDHTKRAVSDDQTKQEAISSTVQDCEVCAHVANEVFSFLAQYQHQLRGNRAVQDDLARRHGLCPLHLRQFEAIAAPREICTGFAMVLEEQARHLRSSIKGCALSPRVCDEIQQGLPTTATCRVCEAAQQAVSAGIAKVAEHLERDRAALPNLSAIEPEQGI
jgi:small GTP-binding protein